jgi:putative hydrolase of the HAD superfamily
MAIKRHKKRLFNVSGRELDGAKGVLLDLDNTLYEYAPCHEAGLITSYKHFSSSRKISPGEFRREYNLAKEKTKSDAGKTAASHSRLLYFQKFSESYFGKTGALFSLKMEEAYWKGFFEKMELLTGVSRFLADCSGRGIKICVVTDLTARIQLKKIIALGVDKYIDFVVSSEEAGSEKPSKKIFSLALNKLELGPKEVVFVGDDHERDSGAEALGIRTILL